MNNYEKMIKVLTIFSNTFKGTKYCSRWKYGNVCTWI